MSEISRTVNLSERSTLFITGSAHTSSGTEMNLKIDGVTYSAPRSISTGDSLGQQGVVYGVTTLDPGAHTVVLVAQFGNPTRAYLQIVIGENTEASNLIA